MLQSPKESCFDAEAALSPLYVPAGQAVHTAACDVGGACRLLIVDKGGPPDLEARCAYGPAVARSARLVGAAARLGASRRSGCVLWRYRSAERQRVLRADRMRVRHA